MAKSKLTMEDIKVGDKLRLVTHDVPTRDPNGMGIGVVWENAWMDEMSTVSLGTVGIVHEVGRSGVRFSPLSLVGWEYSWPLSAFELVRNKKKVYK